MGGRLGRSTTPIRGKGTAQTKAPSQEEEGRLVIISKTALFGIFNDAYCDRAIADRDRNKFLKPLLSNVERFVRKWNF